MILWQIDVPSAIQDKVLRAAQRYLAGKEVIPSIFDDAQLTVFKELLQYWAGFKRSFQPPEDPTKRPSMLGTTYYFILLKNVGHYLLFYSS